MKETVGLKALLDNNIFTRILSLVKGGNLSNAKESTQEATKLSCAIMCFMILGDFDIHYHLPLYERTYSKAEGNRIEDIYYFRVAMKLFPQLYADVALGKTDCFPMECLEFTKNIVTKEYTPIDISIYNKVFIDWKYIYHKLLKACVIWKETSNNIEKVEQYMQWVKSNSLFMPATEAFVFLLFSEERLSKMIKGINSGNIDKLISGIKNAAWDLSYSTLWEKKAREEQGKTIWFICSNDGVLKKIAGGLLLEKGSDKDLFFRNIFTEYWGAKNGLSVLEQYKAVDDWIKIEGKKRSKFIEEELSLIIDNEILHYEQMLMQS